MSHAFDINRGRHLFFRRKTTLVCLLFLSGHCIGNHIHGPQEMSLQSGVSAFSGIYADSHRARLAKNKRKSVNIDLGIGLNMCLGYSKEPSC